jgi:hypothetical protein
MDKVTKYIDKHADKSDVIDDVMGIVAEAKRKCKLKNEEKKYRKKLHKLAKVCKYIEICEKIENIRCIFDICEKDNYHMMNAKGVNINGNIMVIKTFNHDNISDMYRLGHGGSYNLIINGLHLIDESFFTASCEFVPNYYEDWSGIDDIKEKLGLSQNISRHTVAEFFVDLFE